MKHLLRAKAIQDVFKSKNETTQFSCVYHRGSLARKIPGKNREDLLPIYISTRKKVLKRVRTTHPRRRTHENRDVPFLLTTKF